MKIKQPFLQDDTLPQNYNAKLYMFYRIRPKKMRSRRYMNEKLPIQRQT